MAHLDLFLREKAHKQRGKSFSRHLSILGQVLGLE